MTPEEYYAAVKDLGLSYSGRGSVWIDRDGDCHHVPSPYGIPYDRRREILEDIKKGLNLPN
jgi:hypothetical protein